MGRARMLRFRPFAYPGSDSVKPSGLREFRHFLKGKGRYNLRLRRNLLGSGDQEGRTISAMLTELLRGLEGRWILALLGLALGSLGLYLAGASGYDLLTDDEMRYAEAGRRMVESGHWVVPEYNGYPRYQKPVLFYWLQAISQALLGSTPLAARLPTAVAGMLLVLVVASVARTLWGIHAGWWTGIVLAVMAGIVLLSRMVMTDIVLLLFLQTGLGAFYVARVAEPPERGRWYLTMWAAFALGFLTKGPIAYVLPAAFLLPWLSWRGELLSTAKEVRPAVGLAVSALVAGPWYALVHYVSDGQFTRHFFLTENLGRFLTNVNPHEAPPFLYFLILIPLTFPWAGLLPQVVRQAVAAPVRGPFREAIPALLLWQAILVFVVFTFSRTRVWTYTLPMLPPLALLLGKWLAERLSEPAANPLRIPLWVFLGVSVALAVAGGCVTLDRLPEPVRDVRFLFWLRFAAVLLAVLSGGVLLVDYLRKPRWTVAALVVSAVGFYLTLVHTLAPTADELLRGPVRRAAEAIRLYPGSVVVTCHVHELGLNFLTGHRVVLHWRTHVPEDLAALLEAEGRVFVLIAPERWQDYAGLRLFVWDRNPRFVLAASVPPPAAPDYDRTGDSATQTASAPGRGGEAFESSLTEAPR